MLECGQTDDFLIGFNGGGGGGGTLRGGTDSLASVPSSRGPQLFHTGADLLPDTDFNFPLPMRLEICLMTNFNL